MKYLIQTIKGKVVHDFSFILLETIGYNNWISKSNDYQYILSDYIKTSHGELIPVGSVEFVTNFIYRFHNKGYKPLNIPESLFKYANRNIHNGINSP